MGVPMVVFKPKVLAVYFLLQMVHNFAKGFFKSSLMSMSLWSHVQQLIIHAATAKNFVAIAVLMGLTQLDYLVTFSFTLFGDLQYSH